MGKIVEALRVGYSVNAGGPMWFAQLWLNAIFHRYMPIEGELPSSSNIESYFLAKCIPRFASADSLTTNFWFMFKKFLETKNFAYDEKINLGPFSDRSPEKSWYRPVRFEDSPNIQKNVSKRSALNGSSTRVRSSDSYSPLNVEIEQAHQLKIDSLDSLLAALSSNEDRKQQQFKPFECVPCMMVTRAFNVWWTTYYKKFIRPFDAIKAGTDKLLAEDQPQRPKPAPKRTADPTGTSKKTTKKTKIEKASVSSKISKTKRSTVPPTPTSQIIPVPPLEPSNVQFDASSGTKISKGDVPPPKASDPKETQPTPLPTYSVSSDSASMHSQQISPISCRPKVPEVISKEADVG
ncbi:hypothetical protein PIB30_079763 [Stylosanthes scabra]|uniref:Aminotransferase-like plant mobile domain-containing protein n=1 Tax=Stylosanthes scabra TaxID=79078 RepID=A0ABU6XTS0_9FABA|nr:hypothetical protein [Stylosanthes scabra]